METYAYYVIALLIGISIFTSFKRRNKKRWKDERKIDFLQ